MYVDCDYCEDNECINCNRCEVEHYMEMVKNGEIYYNAKEYIKLCLTGNCELEFIEK